MTHKLMLLPEETLAEEGMGNATEIQQYSPAPERLGRALAVISVSPKMP